MIITADEAKGILAPYINAFQNCVLMGLSDYNSSYVKVRHIHSPYARAMLVRDHIIAQVRKEFDEVDGIKFINKRGLILLSIEEKIFVRFKKMNERMLTRNHPTLQSIRFSEQLSFEGFFTPTTNINVGYIPNDVWTEPRKILITCPNGSNSNSWYIDISQDNAVLLATVVPIEDRDLNIKKKRIHAKNTRSQASSQM